MISKGVHSCAIINIMLEILSSLSSTSGTILTWSTKKEKCTLLVSPTNVAFNDKLAFLVSSKPLFFCTLKCHFFFIDSFTVKIRAILRQNSASSQLLAFYCTDSKQNIQCTFSTHYYCITDKLRGLKLESMRGPHFEKRARGGQHMEIKCLLIFMFMRAVKTGQMGHMRPAGPWDHWIHIFV